MQFVVKAFNELSALELYNLLRLRSEVFVVEQNCVFLDMDNKDQIALHILGFMDHELVACTRLYDTGQYYPESSIGRVVVSPRYRDRKLGHLLMKKSISVIENKFDTTTIRIGAQCYLTKFYESHGFAVVGETYLEDGIEHVEMVRN